MTIRDDLENKRINSAVNKGYFKGYFEGIITGIFATIIAGIGINIYQANYINKRFNPQVAVVFEQSYRELRPTAKSSSNEIKFYSEARDSFMRGKVLTKESGGYRDQLVEIAKKGRETRAVLEAREGVRR